MSLRGAARRVVEGSRFENTPGIRVQGRDPVVVHNVNPSQRRRADTGKPGRRGQHLARLRDELSPDNAFPQHDKAAEGCLVANNTIVDPPLYGLVIGGGKGQDWKEKGIRDVPPSRNRIVSNIIVGKSGELLVIDGAPDNVVDTNLVFASGDAGSGDYRLAPDSPTLKSELGATAALRVYGPDAPE
jgi:hypothetical protein